MGGLGESDEEAAKELGLHGGDRVKRMREKEECR
jgi:hypothetical protein